MLIHGAPYRHLVFDVRTLGLAHSQNTVSLLRVKKIRFFVDATKNKVKSIFIRYLMFAKVYLVVDNEAGVATPLHIPLIKLAPIIPVL